MRYLRLQFPGATDLHDRTRGEGLGPEGEEVADVVGSGRGKGRERTSLNVRHGPKPRSGLSVGL